MRRKNVQIGKDVLLGKNVKIGDNVKILGCCKIGNDVCLMSGVILEDVTVGDGSVIESSKIVM